MSRLLKFRVWDKRKRAFVPFTDVAQLTNPTCEINQFTGCYDAAGNELYEGDITRYVCRYEDGPIDGVELYIVCFENGSFGMNMVDGQADFQPFENLNLTDNLIGNRYEHPYLLRKAWPGPCPQQATMGELRPKPFSQRKQPSRLLTFAGWTSQ